MDSSGFWTPYQTHYFKALFEAQRVHEERNKNLQETKELRAELKCWKEKYEKLMEKYVELEGKIFSEEDK